MSTDGCIDRTGKRIAALTGTTDASGNVTFAFTPAFAAVPVVTITPGPTGNANLVDSRITALSASSCTVNVQQALSVTVLALQVLAAKVPANGVTVQLIATEAGQV